MVQLTSSATGEVQVLDVEAPSEEAALEMFDASEYAVSIVQSDAMDQASRERVDRLRQKAEAIDKAIARGLVPKLFVLVVVAAAIVGCGLFALLNSQVEQGSGDRNHSEESDAEKALRGQVILDR